MSSRLSATHEVAYSMDETHSAMPAFLRKKVEEGKGRKQKKLQYPPKGGWSTIVAWGSIKKAIALA